jgi:hypothetical protein
MISETEIAQHLARSIRGKHSPGRLTLVTGAAIVGTFKDLYLDNEITRLGNVSCIGIFRPR